MDDAERIAVIAARLENAEAIVTAAGRTGLPLPAAAALAEVESGGRNVFGHDAGGVHAAERGVDVPVTRELYEELVRRVAAGERSNGVGPAQITWPPLFAQAAERGLRLWVPEDNLTLGFELFLEHVARARRGSPGLAEDELLARAGTLYNAGTLAHGVTGYGRRLARSSAQWGRRLGVTAPLP